LIEIFSRVSQRVFGGILKFIFENSFSARSSSAAAEGRFRSSLLIALSASEGLAAQVMRVENGRDIVQRVAGD
jgi:hypothetical protein